MNARCPALATAAAITVACLACSGNAGGRLPAIASKSPDRPIEVVVLRNRNLYGSGLTRKVFVDGWIVATLGVGQYVRFHVAEGTHSIGTNQASVAVEFLAHPGPYYFVISVDGGNWGAAGASEIERIETGKALKAIESYRQVQ